MANSTGIVLAAGGFVLTDKLLNDSPKWETIMPVVVGTGLATVAAAGLDSLVPGLGTGTAWVMLIAALFTTDTLLRIIKALKLDTR